MAYRSRLPPAKREDYIFTVDAAYGADVLRPVCSVCWSLLDYRWGKDPDAYEHPLLISQKSGEWEDSKGNTWLVWEESNRCCNPECDSAVLYRYLPSKLSIEMPYHPEDIKKFLIKNPLYKQGQYYDDGVFRVDEDGQGPKCIRLDQNNLDVKVDIKYPWVYISPGKFKKEIPGSWTMESGRIKTRCTGARFQQIRQWFATRRIRIDEPLNPKLIT